MIFLFSLLFFLGASAVLLSAARHDWRSMTIPDELSLALIGLFIIGILMPTSIFPGIRFVPGLIGGGIIFALTILFYSMNMMGGGDTKLAGALGLLLGVGHLALFLLVMTIAGGLLGLYAVMARKYPARLLPASPAIGSWLAQIQQGQNKVPYALAIAAGGIVTLFAKWITPLLANLAS